MAEKTLSVLEILTEEFRDWTLGQIQKALGGNGAIPNDLEERLCAIEETLGLSREDIREILDAIGDGGNGDGSLPVGVVTRRALIPGSDYIHARTEEDSARLRPARGMKERVWSYIGNGTALGLNRTDMLHAVGYPKDVAHYGPLGASADGFTFNTISQTVVPEDGSNPATIVVTYEVLDNSGQKCAVIGMEFAPGYAAWYGDNEWRRSNGIGYRLYLEEVHSPFYLEYFDISLSWAAYEEDCVETVWAVDFAQPVGDTDEFALRGDFAVDWDDLLDEDLLEALRENSDFTGEETIAGAVEMIFSRYSDTLRLNCRFGEEKLVELFGPEISMIVWAVGNVGVGVPVAWDGDKASVKLRHMQLPELIEALNSNFSIVELRDFILAAFLKFTTPAAIIKTEVRGA